MVPTKWLAEKPLCPVEIFLFPSIFCGLNEALNSVKMKFWNGPYLPTFLVYWDAFLLLYVFEHIQDDITGVVSPK